MFFYNTPINVKLHKLDQRLTNSKHYYKEIQMARRSSFLLALLFIANPFVLLFYQNCSSAPKHHVQHESSVKAEKAPASITPSQERRYDRSTPF